VVRTDASTLVVLVGATAAGKTSLALEVAREFSDPLELISLDSRQIYRGLDLGTGKPSLQEREALPHHLVDIIDPAESFDAGRYRRCVEELLPELRRRGVTPIVVGGAGFYLRALQEGFFDLPENPELLARLRREWKEVSGEELRSRLREVDPERAEQLHPNDRYRLERALEIHALSGKSMSELAREFTPRPVLGMNLRVFHLQPARWKLHAKIARRAEQWLRGGWIEETRALLEEGWAEDSPGLSILGYREIVSSLRNPGQSEDLLERILVATRRYARQQEIWFRKLEVELRATPENPALQRQLLQALRESAPS
jgi:tRNA dimethylallyltransferase